MGGFAVPGTESSNSLVLGKWLVFDYSTSEGYCEAKIQQSHISHFELFQGKKYEKALLYFFMCIVHILIDYASEILFLT